MSVVRVTVKAVMEYIQVVRLPADRERSCHTPKVIVMEMIVERVIRRIRVVINRVCARVVIVDRTRLIHDDLLRLVVRNINNIILDGRYLDRALVLGDKLVVIALQVASGIRPVAETLDGRYNVGLLRYNSLAKSPRPIEILIKEFDNLGIVEQCDDRIIPILIRLER